jgi:hypothetical protein
MKSIVERLGAHAIVCKKLTPITPKRLHSRKKISLYVGVDLDGYYCSVMVLAKKSRVVRKEAEELFVLQGRLEAHVDAAINKKYVWVDAPLCSKAKALMEQEGWVFL